jgi:hypothetical protein
MPETLPPNGSKNWDGITSSIRMHVRHAKPR